MAKRKVSISVKRDALNVQKITQSPIAHAKEDLRLLDAYYESNYSANYKDYMIYKDLQKRFFPVYYGEK